MASENGVVQDVTYQPGKGGHNDTGKTNEKDFPTNPKYGTDEDIGSTVEGLVLDKYGVRLHPQPTKDPFDPLNWSKTRKHVMLAIIMSLYFMFTFVTTVTVPTFPDLQTQYNATASQINWTIAIPALGLAVGPLVWSSISDTIGRRVIFIIGTLIAFLASIGAAKASNYSGYMAARFFQGFGTSPASIVGLAIINDLFFDYERGQKYGLWVVSIDLGLLIAPLIGGFMAEVSTAWIQWLTAILLAAILVAEILFLPESLYPRNSMLRQLPRRASLEKSEMSENKFDESATGMKRTKRLPLLNIKPVPGVTYPMPWDALLRFLRTWPYFGVSVPIFIYSFTWYWWLLCLITEVPVAYVDFSVQSQGLLFLGLIIGTIIAEIFFSGTLSDWMVKRQTLKNGGVRTPEMRLWLIYPAAVFTAIGFIVWGISVDQGYHWIVGQVMFAFVGAGIQVGNTIVAAYVVDAYPLQSMSIITFYAVLLNFSAFASPFFIAPWITANGFTWSFAAQGIMTIVLGAGGMGVVHWIGPSLRQKQGMMPWVNSEFENS